MQKKITMLGLQNDITNQRFVKKSRILYVRNKE